MAVSSPGPGAPVDGVWLDRRRLPDPVQALEHEAPRQVRSWDFMRLKLRIIGNGMHGQSSRIVLFVFRVMASLVMAGIGLLAFVGSGVVDSSTGLVLVTYAGSALVLGWLLLPLLFFGVDETLDPARFALFPLPRRTLAVGMLAAACVGTPAVATMLALLGLVVAGALRAGAAGALTGLAGAVLGALLCVVASRAVTSAMAAMLRSRRVRDLTAVILALLSASLGPLNLLISSGSVGQSSRGPLLLVARILGWTPFASGFVAPYDIAAGRPLLAVARLALVAVAVLLLLWWWSHTLESAMLGGSSEGPAGGAVRGGAVAALLPRLVRGARPGVFTAILARELRYWWRDPRRRSALISIVIGGSVMPIALTLFAAQRDRSGVALPISAGLACSVSAVIMANQFGFDGTAYSVHLLAGVAGRTELRARAAALSLYIAPVLLVVAVVVGLISGSGGRLVPTVGTMAATFGTSLGTTSLISALAPYPVPESRNAFASNNGSGSVKGFLSFVAMVGSMVVAAPVLLGSVLLPVGWRWLVAPVGVAWGIGALLVATRAGAKVLDRRGPELLAAVTPRR